MKLAKVLLLSLCLLALVPQFALGQSFNSANRFRKNEGAILNHYIVVFNESVPSGRVDAFAARLAQAHGGKVGFTYQSALRGFSVEMKEAQAVALSHHPQVAYVEEDALVEGAGVQHSPVWTLDRLDQRNLPLNASYNYATTGAGVNAYIIDSGIRRTHHEFGDRVVLAYDNVGDGRNGMDCNGHGTFVAGIVGSDTYGVAKGVKLHSVRVLNCSNVGSTANTIAGMDWVAANSIKPAVANLSFMVANIANSSIDLAVRNLIASGVTTVVAAGNNGMDAGTRSPARVTEAITVAASDENDNRATSSNFGAVVDVFAPGANIFSTSNVNDTSTHIRSGTSFAAPFVTGLVARYLAARPGDQPDAVVQAIRNAATPGIVFNPGADTPNLLAYAGITLSDDFNDNARDAATWLAPTATDITVAEQNGRLEIRPAAAAAGYDGYKSATTADLTDSRVSVEASTGQRIEGFGSYLALSHSSTDYLRIGIGGQNLMAQQEVGGVLTTTSFLYDAAQHRLWRIRHDRADDHIYWEASSDGVTWTTLRAEPRAFPITGLQTIFTAGKLAATTPTTTATFDNLWHEANPPPSVAYADDFNDNALNRAMWQSGDANADTVIQEQNGQLEVMLPPNTAGYYSLGFPSPIDFRDKTMQVEVQPASQAGWVQTHFQMYFDPNNYYLFQTSNNGLTCDVMVNGVLDRTGFTWDGSRFWRYRHDADANTVSFETSADGATWTTRKTVAASFPLSAVIPVIGAGAWGTGNSAPGTAVFDNFRIERHRPLFPQSDNFNDNTRDTKRWNVPETTDFTVVEQNGRLEVTPGASVGHEGYTSVNPLDLTDARAAVEFVSAPLLAYCASYFILGDANTGNTLLTGVSGGALLLQQDVGGIVSRTIITYNAAQHRFLRIRHNRADDYIYWETSPDNVAWTVQRAAPRPFPITNLQARLIAGRGSLSAPPVTVVFDNLRIERNEFGQARTGGGGGASGGSGGSGSSGGSTNSYNAVANFSHAQNPAAPWAYGYQPPSGAFTLFESASTAFGEGSNTWASSSQGCCPMVTKNSTASTYTYVNAPSVVQPADVLNLHPGPGGERSVVRWTAPTAGAHLISGRFQGLDTAGTTSDVLITHNGTTVFSRNVNGYGAEAPFSLTRTVAAGDIVEFSAGYGGNLNYHSDSTGLAATINPTNDAPQKINAAPHVNAGLDATLNEGSTFSGTASFTDLDPTDTWTVTVDYGDGTGAQPVTPTQSKTIPLSHVYKDNAANPYMVTVTVTDSAGASSTDTALVTSVNAPPTPAITGAQPTIREETSITLGSTVSDPGEADAAAGFKYLWTVTQYGTAISKRMNEVTQSTFNFREWAGTYVVTLRVTDKDGGAGTASTTITVNKIEQNDNFDDNSRDTLRWSTKATPGMTVAEQNGQLQVTTPGSTTVGYDGYYGRRSFDLMTRSAAVEAVQPAYHHGLDTYFVLEDTRNTGNLLLFVVGGAPGSLLLEDRVNGTVTSRTQIPYDTTQHRFWRFRRDPVADILNWETSPDNIHWTVRHTAPRRFDLTSMRAQLYAGRYTTTTPPMTAIFDNYRVEDVPQPPISLSDNFNDNLLDTTLWTVKEPTSPSPVREQNQRLEMLLTTITAEDAIFGGSTGNSVESVSPYNFWNRALQVEVLGLKVQEAKTYFRLSFTNSAYYSMSVTSNMLNCDVLTDKTDRTTVAYSASAHRFWRFRHDAAAHTINFEVSADGQAWTTLKTVLETYPLDSMKVVLGASNWSTSTSGTAIFDNVKIEANK